MSNRVLNIPNSISFTRLLAVPFFWWAILSDRFLMATVIVATVGSTDWLDGYLARRLNQVTELGKLLDPLADRIMIASAVIGGMIVDVIPLIIGLPLIFREILVALGAVYLARAGGGTLAVRYLGKVATFLIYWAIPFFYLAEATPWHSPFTWLAWIVGVVGLVLYYWVGFAYLGDIRSKVKRPTIEPG